MNQHQIPSCRWAILFIRRKVPPRKVDVEAKASFWWSTATTISISSSCRAKSLARMTYHPPESIVAISYLVAYSRRNLSHTTSVTFAFTRARIPS